MQSPGNMGTNDSSFELRITQKGGCVAASTTVAANYDGNDILTLLTSRKSDCATKCEQDTRCKLFTSAPGGRNGKRSCRFKHENSTLGGGTSMHSSHHIEFMHCDQRRPNAILLRSTVEQMLYR